MKNWLEIVVGLYLLAMVLYGHYRGFIRMAVSMAALVATFVIVHTTMPAVSGFIKDQTPLCQWIKEGLEYALIFEEDSADSADAEAMIESLNLPKAIQESLLEAVGPELNQTFGTEILLEHIGTYVADVAVNAAGFVLMFVLVYVALRLIMGWLNIMAKLPVISGINKLAGALLGGLQGLFFLWLLSLLVTAFSQTDWGMAVIAQIESSKWLTFLYHYNIVSKIVLGLVKGIL